MHGTRRRQAVSRKTPTVNGHITGARIFVSPVSKVDGHRARAVRSGLGKTIVLSFRRAIGGGLIIFCDSCPCARDYLLSAAGDCHADGIAARSCPLTDWLTAIRIQRRRKVAPAQPVEFRDFSQQGCRRLRQILAYRR